MEHDRQLVRSILTLREAADIARCSPNTLRAAILRADLAAKNIGSGRRQYWRITRCALQRWLESDPISESVDPAAG